MTDPTTERQRDPIPSVEPAEMDGFGRRELEAMAAAGARVLECQRALATAGTSVVGEVLSGRDGFFEWDHFPAGDVYDWKTHAQYYYHSHPPENRGDLFDDEHGHFHTFLRRRGMPEGIRPLPLDDFRAPADPDDLLTHFIAISMDRTSAAIRLFTTNRWVTGENWYAAEDVIAMLPLFGVEHDRPNRHVNDWISNLVALFRPDIEKLLRRRDEVIAARADRFPRINVYEDRALELTSSMDVSVERRLAELALRIDGAHP